MQFIKFDQIRSAAFQVSKHPAAYSFFFCRLTICAPLVTNFNNYKYLYAVHIHICLLCIVLLQKYIFIYYLTIKKIVSTKIWLQISLMILSFILSFLFLLYKCVWRIFCTFQPQKNPPPLCLHGVYRAHNVCRANKWSQSEREKKLSILRFVWPTYSTYDGFLFSFFLL